jgi:hypothetical protein
LIKDLILYLLINQLIIIIEPEQGNKSQERAKKQARTLLAEENKKGLN